MGSNLGVQIAHFVKIVEFMPKMKLIGTYLNGTLSSLNIYIYNVKNKLLDNMFCYINVGVDVRTLLFMA